MTDGTQNKTKILNLPGFSRIRRILLYVLVLTISMSHQVEACGIYCTCVPPPMAETIALVHAEHADTRAHITALFLEHEDFLLNEFWPMFLPAMMKMTEQISAVAMQQMEIIGALFDAKGQLETQLLLQAMEADAVDDYEGGGDNIGLCILATNVRSLASSESYAKMNAFVLSQRSQDRQLGNVNSSAAEGEHIDRRNRMRQFKERYCDPHDNGGGLKILCATPPPPDRINIDINYSQLIDEPMTLNVDFCNLDGIDGTCVPDATAEETEIDIWALANNLYAHNVFLRIPEAVIQLPENQARYLDVRSIVAKRSVAENSFNIITGMKAKGSPTLTGSDDEGNVQDVDSADTAAYMLPLLQEVYGSTITAADIQSMLGAYPSYYAQMDFLTKRIYQRREFYAGLYDTPENIKRRSVAMKAIDLMQNLDTLKSALRTEMMLSILLETGVMDLQESVQNKLNPQREVGKQN